MFVQDCHPYLSSFNVVFEHDTVDPKHQQLFRQQLAIASEPLGHVSQEVLSNVLAV